MLDSLRPSELWILWFLFHHYFWKLARCKIACRAWLTGVLSLLSGIWMDLVPEADSTIQWLRQLIGNFKSVDMG